MIILEDAYLAHYGVKGMKWGVRRNRRTSEKKHKVSKSGNTYSIKDKNGNILSKLNFYDYKIKGFDWVLMANLDTKRGHRGKGMATSLLNELYDDVSKQNKGLYMFVKSDNTTAINLYSKLDFEKIKDYKLNDGDYVIMAKGKANKKQFDKMNFS